MNFILPFFSNILCDSCVESQSPWTLIPTQPGVTLSYSGFGSGRGICRIKNATKECASTDTGVPLAVDFAGSNHCITPKYLWYATQ